MKTINAKNFPETKFIESKIKYINREKIKEFTNQWLKKIIALLLSKYKSLFMERNYSMKALTNDLLQELKTVDFENTKLSSFTIIMEKKILKNLGKKELKKVKLVTCENIEEFKTKSKTCNNIINICPNDHQKQQILNNQRNFVEGNLLTFKS